VECGMWNVECGMWNVECGMWNVECGMWNVECGILFKSLKINGFCLFYHFVKSEFY
jgi:hypothetical protein